MLKTIGFVNSHKEHEMRIALLPEDMAGVTDVSGQLIFEEGYGKNLGIDDEEYVRRGAKIASREDILKNCDIICDPKIGDAEYLGQLKEGQSIFGWVHLQVSEAVKKILLENKINVFAWEEMMNNGGQLFYKNNELAGEASVNHACQCYGMLPEGKKAAILGRGNTGRGAYKTLVRNGAQVTVYGRHEEEQFKKEIGNYDIIVNAVLWGGKRKDHIIDRALLKQAKKRALLVDVSCDENGAVETCRPTTYENPTYVVEGVVHYCVDHTPSMYFRTASGYVSEQVKRLVRPLVTGEYDELLESGHIMENGSMLKEISYR